MMTTRAVKEIVVGERTRRDMGDIDALARSIEERGGLIHPVVIRSDGSLIVGARRIEACRRLGWREVPVVVRDDLDSATEALLLERDENTCRKDFTPSERAALTARLLELERPRAKERQREGGARGGRAQACAPQGTSLDRATKIAGKAAGWSRTSYQRAKEVLDAAASDEAPDTVRELAEEMDAGELTVSAAHKALRAQNGRRSPKKPKGRSATKVMASAVVNLRALTQTLETLSPDEFDDDAPAQEWIKEIERTLSALRATRSALRRRYALS